MHGLVAALVHELQLAVLARRRVVGPARAGHVGGHGEEEGHE